LNNDEFQWVLGAVVCWSGATAQRNIFFPGSASYVSAQQASSAQSPLPNRLSGVSKSVVTSTPGPNEERRLLEVPKPGDALQPAHGSREVKPLDFIPPTRFSTPKPPMSDFFNNDRSHFFSTLNQPGFFGTSPFGLNDFGLQSFPRFDSGPDFSIFNSGANSGNGGNGGTEQPKSFHLRREYNDKDGYTPWVDAGPKRPPVAAGEQGQSQQGGGVGGPGFHQRFDLGPDGFFDFNKDKKSAQPGSAGFSGQTQAIMRIDPKSGAVRQQQQQVKDQDLRNRMQQLNYNFNNNNLNNFPSTSTLAQNFKPIRWPGQN